MERIVMRTLSAATGPVRSAFDRRTPHRAPCRVRVVAVDAEDPAELAGETINIGTGGVAVRITSSIAVGQRVEIRISHAEQMPLCVFGEVAHCRRSLADQFEVGVRFV